MVIDEKAQIYNKLSSFYDKMFFVLKPGHTKVGQYLKDNNIKNILEVGIGTGLTFEHYAPGTKIHGVDMSRGMLDGAEAKIDDYQQLQITLEQMDAQALKFEDNSFECTYAPSLLSVVPQPQKLLDEMLRVTKVGGKVIIVSHFQESGTADALFSKVSTPVTLRLFGFRTDMGFDIIEKLPNAKVLHKEKVNPVGPFCLSHLVILEKTA